MKKSCGEQRLMTFKLCLVASTGGERVLRQPDLAGSPALLPSFLEWIGEMRTPECECQDDEKLSLHMPHLQSHLMKMARSCITSQLNLSQADMCEWQSKASS
eukprot:6367932-Amphidinium_carterae.3